jgi:hypothetical protein
MLARPSKRLALLMTLLLVGLGVAPVKAICAAPCCKTAQVVTPGPLANPACHAGEARKPVENSPPCLLEGHHPTDVATGGTSLSELRGNRLLDALWASVTLPLCPSTWAPETNGLGAGPPLLHPSRPIYILSVSLLC